MKKYWKYIRNIFIVLVVIYSSYIIYTFFKEKELMKLLTGINKLEETDTKIVRVSKVKQKYLMNLDDEAVRNFDKVMLDMGWVYVSNFGRCSLYEQNGLEILVRRTKLFNRYFLFELMDDKFFESEKGNMFDVA